MDGPPMTPTSALLYTYLELDAFKTPDAVAAAKAGIDLSYTEQDVFAQAFGIHDTVDVTEAKQRAAESFKNIAHPQQSETTYQSIYMSPPLSTDATGDSPLKEMSDLETSSKKSSIASMSESNESVVLSDLPSYLAHVLSTSSPDDFFSYAQKTHYGMQHGQVPDQEMCGDENLPHEVAIYSDNGQDPSWNPCDLAGGAIPLVGKLYNEQLLPKRQQQQSIAPYSGAPMSTTSSQPTASASPITKTKKTRRRRNNRSAEEEARRHQEFLERNRKAAGKCRSRKKDRVQKLVVDVDEARAWNGELKAEKNALEQEIGELRKLIGGCGCACLSAAKVGISMLTGKEVSQNDAADSGAPADELRRANAQRDPSDEKDMNKLNPSCEIDFDLEMDDLEMVDLDEEQEEEETMEATGRDITDS
ncbi:hypothetical protein BP5796_06212 [Coleophoma crateriformis]|uniref:BZIP domain-containing protein n=1 Tax=Coleophoma crateriformis TaxID=565419 RepID=A0A3D8RWQ4_9HELO|nr:hypothetical protein BP5796_06212 [Coleophoma crateriformis]